MSVRTAIDPVATTGVETHGKVRHWRRDEAGGRCFNRKRLWCDAATAAAFHIIRTFKNVFANSCSLQTKVMEKRSSAD
jgi:hypothetical protein